MSRLTMDVTAFYHYNYLGSQGSYKRMVCQNVPSSTQNVGKSVTLAYDEAIVSYQKGIFVKIFGDKTLNKEKWIHAFPLAI